MGGSPLLWSELADALAYHTTIDRQTAQRYVDVCRGHMTTEQARTAISAWFNAGVDPATVARTIEAGV